jgi:Ca2+-binding RTX toxin-like protein
MATTSVSLPVLTRAYQIFENGQVSTTEIANLSSMVDQGIESLSQAIVSIFNSQQTVLSNSQALARMFFILFNRAPDFATFSGAMSMLNNGSQLTDLAQLGLNMGTSSLTNSLGLSNHDFVMDLAQDMFSSGSGPAGLAETEAYLISQLNTNLMSRAQVLALAANYSNKTNYSSNVNPSLYYLAATGIGASNLQLASASGYISDVSLVNQILINSGQSPFAPYPFFSFNGSKLSIANGTTDVFSINLQTLSSSLASNGNYRLFSSYDSGSSISSTTFNSGLLSNVLTLDATQMTGPPKSFSATASNAGSVIYAPNTSSTLYGGSGSDVLIGGSSNDSIYIGTGKSTDTGGAGIDTFYFPSATSLRATQGLGATNFQGVTSTQAIATITDFGYGSDILNFGITDGNLKPTAAKLIVGNADWSSSGFVNLSQVTNDSVILVDNTGNWTSTTATGSTQVDLSPRTPTQIASLFTLPTKDASSGAITPTSIFLSTTVKTPPTTSQNYFVISYDPINGADVWLISNMSDVLNVTPNEVQLIGHLQPNAYGDLWSVLQSTGAVVA